MGELINDPEDLGTERWWLEEDGYWFDTLGERIGPFRGCVWDLTQEDSDRTRHHVFDVLNEKRPRWLEFKPTDEGPIVVSETCVPERSRWVDGFLMLKEEALIDPDVGAAARAWVAGDDDAYYRDRWRFLAEWDADEIIDAMRAD